MIIFEHSNEESARKPSDYKTDYVDITKDKVEEEKKSPSKVIKENSKQQTPVKNNIE